MKNAPNTVQNKIVTSPAGFGCAGSKAPDGNKRSDTTSTTTGAPARTATSGRARRRASVFRAVSTAHCRTGRSTQAAMPPGAPRAASSRGASPAAPSWSATPAGSPATGSAAGPSSGGSSALAGSRPGVSTGPGAPAECGPAVSGTSGVRPRWGGTDGTETPLTVR